MTPAEELKRLREKAGDWAQCIQNGSALDTHIALCEMLDEADKGDPNVQFKYDPRRSIAPDEKALDGPYSPPESRR